MWLFSCIIDVDICQAKPIKLELVMTVATVKEENKIKIGIKMFQSINAVFKLADHMAVSPISVAVFPCSNSQMKRDKV